MGKVDCIRLESYDLWFHSSDHLPPHFHCAKTSEWEIRVYFLDCTHKHGLAYDLKWGRKPRSPVKRHLNKSVIENRAELLREWEQKVIVY